MAATYSDLLKTTSQLKPVHPIYHQECLNDNVAVRSIDEDYNHLLDIVTPGRGKMFGLFKNVPGGVGGQAEESKYVLSTINAIMLLSLQDEKWIDSLGRSQFLVPRVYEYWNCPSNFVLKTDVWDGSLLGLGTRQRRNYDASLNIFTSYYGTTRKLLFTVDQLQDMFAMAQRLDELKVVHGQFEPSNLLYRELPASSAISTAAAARVMDMAVTNFSEAQTYGSSSTKYGCPSSGGGGSAVQRRYMARIDPALQGYYNRWQLSTYLSSECETLISDSIPRSPYQTPSRSSGGGFVFTVDASGKFVKKFVSLPTDDVAPVDADTKAVKIFGRFAGIDGIPEPWYEQLKTDCPLVVYDASSSTGRFGRLIPEYRVSAASYLPPINTTTNAFPRMTFKEVLDAASSQRSSSLNKTMAEYLQLR
jgi:hypothetical protein